jgi:hypothetical protein
MLIINDSLFKQHCINGFIATLRIIFTQHNKLNCKIQQLHFNETQQNQVSIMGFIAKQHLAYLINCDTMRHCYIVKCVHAIILERQK